MLNDYNNNRNKNKTVFIQRQYEKKTTNKYKKSNITNKNK